MKRLNVDWTKHLRAPEDKKNFEDLVRNSTLVLSRLRDILQERQDTLTKSETFADDFESPAWPFRQAYRNGARSSYNDIDLLLSFLGTKEA